MHLRVKDLIAVGGCFVILFGFGWMSWLFWGDVAIFLLLSGAASVIVAVQLRNYRDIQRQLDRQSWHYGELTTLFSIFSLLEIKHPMPPMRSPASSPAMASTLVSLIFDRKPTCILEVGSGVSTLVAAYCLKRLGTGYIVSLDHDLGFADISAENVRKHHLEDYAEVVFAPLKEVVVHDQSWSWYDISCLKDIEVVDMLIIDGPPRRTQKLARYPAVPILLDKLNENTVIVVDDTDRADEKEILRMWLEEFQHLAIDMGSSSTSISVLQSKP